MQQTVKTFLIAVCAGFVGAFAYQYFFSANTQNPDNQFINNKNTSAQFADYRRQENTTRALPSVDFVKAASLSTNSVVYIKTISAQRQTYTWFDMFFGNGGGAERVLGSGSGVIFSKDGYIVTNNHVIADASGIEVVHNKRTYQAQIVGIDPSTDLALLKVNSQNLPAIKIASSQTINVGDWVLAVGNPFNLTSTVTAGIVSAKGRNINIVESQFPIESFIQTDAAINPGNSGGALVNTNGELVGINTAILSKTGSYAGYGFAIPSDMVVKIIADLKEYGQVQKAFLGAEIQDIDEKIYESLQLDDISGVVISYVDSEGAAGKVGLQRGDIILKINNMAIDSKANFDEQISYRKPGDKVTIQYKREGKVKEKEVQLTNIEGTTTLLKRETFKAASLGAELESVPKVERNKLGIEGGVRILKVGQGLIAQMQLDEGFIVIDINNRPIENPEELVSILERIRGRVIVRGINKNGARRSFQYLF